ncbi:MAG: UDP-glucose 4-epimerase GalE [Xanthomonadales bacterium]|nr:UDP-glucose 4-epimerase GalE [Xanthomonadales bacterium]
MPAKTILVCGGAGYIGAHMCQQLAGAGHVPVSFDNLSSGHRWAVRWGPLVEGDLLDPTALADVLRAYQVDAVMHFAARSLVGESVRQPGEYFRNNVTGTLNLLDAMRNADVTQLVFSSTAAVYGNPQSPRIDETHPTQPINPYGWSKLMAERQIAEYARAYGLRTCCLRYFNAAGADAANGIGEAHEPETHLIPNILLAALDAARGPVSLFGNDYATFDGTCLRDYVHVDDLCDAHLRALAYLDDHAGHHVLNLGSGSGHSVAQVLAACQQACGGRPAAHYVARRAGDPAVLVADTTLAAKELQWQPQKSLHDIVSDALAWHQIPRRE